MNSRIFKLSAVAALLGSAALAGPFEDRIVQNLRDLGYDYIEVKTGPSQVKAEAVRGERKLEVVYDRATGRIISREEERAGAGYRGRTGVEFEVEGEDFLDDSRSSVSNASVAARVPGGAGSFERQIVENLQGMGYEYIEVETGLTQVKAEAVRGDRKLELVFDRATGEIIKREEERAEGEYLGRTGVEFDTDDEDFVDDDDDDRDDDDDDRDDDDRDDDDDDRNDDDDDRDDDRNDDDRDDDRNDDDDDDDSDGDRDDGRDDDDDDDDDDDRDDDDDDGDDD